MNITDPVDEGIDCRGNIMSCRCDVHGENKVAGVVIFVKGVVFVNRIMTRVGGMANARHFVRGGVLCSLVVQYN